MSCKRSKYSTGNDVLDTALREEKLLTARWYAAMSGQLPWKPGEKEANQAKTSQVERVIREEFAKQNAVWFAGLVSA